MTKRTRNAKVGDTNVAANGYHYTKTKERWRLTHHLVAEAELGRAIDTSQERVVFVDGDRKNLDPSNVKVIPKKNGKQQRIDTLKERIQLLQEELSELESTESLTS